MKPFNLEAAKSGDPVQTRSGLKVRLLGFSREGVTPIIVGLVKYPEGNEQPFCWQQNGRFLSDCPPNNDLVMAPITITKYIVTYLDSVDTVWTHVFGTKDSAEKFLADNLSCYKAQILTVTYETQTPSR